MYGGFDVDRDYFVTRGKKRIYVPEAVRDESFAVTNGCRRNYLIAIGHRVPLIDAFLSYILRHEIERMTRSSVDALLL